MQGPGDGSEQEGKFTNTFLNATEISGKIPLRPGSHLVRF